MHSDLPFPDPLSSPLTELQRKEELSEEPVQNKQKNTAILVLFYSGYSYVHTVFSPGLGRSQTARGDR